MLTQEGRIIPTDNGDVRYEYFLKDHLGNTRVSFADMDNDGTADLLQEDHYYPFGMRMDGLSYYGAGTENKYLYNGKELQDDKFGDVGLDWYDYGFRMYDATLARWHVPDPLAHLDFNISPYCYVENNPLRFIDLFGLQGSEPTYAGGTIKPVNVYGSPSTDFDFTTTSFVHYDPMQETWLPSIAYQPTIPFISSPEKQQSIPTQLILQDPLESSLGDVNEFKNEQESKTEKASSGGGEYKGLSKNVREGLVASSFILSYAAIAAWEVPPIMAVLAIASAVPSTILTFDDIRRIIYEAELNFEEDWDIVFWVISHQWGKIGALSGFVGSSKILIDNIIQEAKYLKKIKEKSNKEKNKL